MSELPRKMGFSQELSEYLHRMETVTVAVDVVNTVGVTVIVASRTPVAFKICVAPLRIGSLTVLDPVPIDAFEKRLLAFPELGYRLV